MFKDRTTEKGSFLKLNFKDWFNSQEAVSILRSANAIGIPSTHKSNKLINKKSGLIFLYDDGESEYKKVFYDATWILISALASKNHFYHGLIWLTNED